MTFSDSLVFCRTLIKTLVWRPDPAGIPEFRGWTDTIDRATGEWGEIPRIVWLFWDSEDKPELVRATVARAQKLNPDHEIRLLDARTLSAYLDETEFLHQANLTASHKSDIVRLELLTRHGGIWCDATSILNEDFSWVHGANGPELVAYYCRRDTTDPHYPVIGRWFLAAPKASPFILNWRDEFLKILKLGSHGYFKSIERRPDYASLKQNIDRPEHRVACLAAQIVQNARPPAFHLRKAEAGPFLYQDAVAWNRARLTALLCRLSPPVAVPPFIRLTAGNRSLLPFMIRRGLVRKDSILGRFLES